MHRPLVVLCAHVALCAVLVRNIAQPAGHNNTRESDADGPVHVDAVAVVEVRVLQVDEAALSLRPVGRFAGAGLVGAERLREDDVDEPPGVECFQGADDEHLDHVPEGSGVQVHDQPVCPAIMPEALLGVRETPFEPGADAAHDIVRCVGGVVREEPDTDLDEEQSQREDNVDQIPACAAAEPDGGSEP